MPRTHRPRPGVVVSKTPQPSPRRHHGCVHRKARSFKSLAESFRSFGAGDRVVDPSGTRRAPERVRKKERTTTGPGVSPAPRRRLSKPAASIPPTPQRDSARVSRGGCQERAPPEKRALFALFLGHARGAPTSPPVKVLCERAVQDWPEVATNRGERYGSHGRSAELSCTRIALGTQQSAVMNDAYDRASGMDK